MLSSAIFAAEQHGTVALEQGKANNITELVKHANEAASYESLLLKVTALILILWFKQTNSATSTF